MQRWGERGEGGGGVLQFLVRQGEEGGREGGAIFTPPLLYSKDIECPSHSPLHGKEGRCGRQAARSQKCAPLHTHSFLPLSSRFNRQLENPLIACSFPILLGRKIRRRERHMPRKYLVHGQHKCATLHAAVEKRVRLLGRYH